MSSNIPNLFQSALILFTRRNSCLCPCSSSHVRRVIIFKEGAEPVNLGKSHPVTHLIRIANGDKWSMLLAEKINWMQLYIQILYGSKPNQISEIPPLGNKGLTFIERGYYLRVFIDNPRDCLQN